MKRTMRFASIITTVIFASTVTAAAQNSTTSATVRAQEQTASVSDEAQVGICVRRLSGKVLAEEYAEKNFLPASNLKLVTCGAALEGLGADFRFQTAVAYSGKVGDDGVLYGDLHIVGGGDPTLGSSDPNAVPRDSLFARWVRAVKAVGIRSIAGSVVGDSRRMPAEVNGSWMYEDMATYYGASCSALMFNRNCLELTLRPGAVEGAQVNVEAGDNRFREYSSERNSDGCATGQKSNGCRGESSEPMILTPAEAPWMKIENRCVTGPTGSGDQSYLFVSEFAPAARLGGSFALGKAAKTVSYNNPFADFSCAYEFALHLAGEGISCKAVTATSSCHPTAVFNDTSVFSFETFGSDGNLTYSGHLAPQDSLTTVAVTYSPRLSEIVRETLRVSDNLYAETLLRALTLSNASAPHLSADTEEALKFQAAILRNLGLNLSRTRLADGSGLSRKNSISPAFMVNFLTAMSTRPCFSEFLKAMNTPGPDESLFGTSDAATRRRIRVKSGSMTGVRCYSGYILPSSNDDIIVFSIMINDSTLPQSKLREHIERRLQHYIKQ